MLSRLVRMDVVPRSTDAGLLAIRILVGLILFIKHGYDKLFNFHQMAPTFSDPAHLGPTTSLVFAMLSDGICSLLIIAGLGTRWACIYCFGVIFTAWSLRYHFLFLGRAVGDHGELMVLFLAALIAMFIAGPAATAWMNCLSARAARGY